MVVLVELTHVARVEPAVLIDDFLREFRFLVIAHHHVVATADDFPVFGNLHLCAGQRLSDITHLATVRVAVADGNHRRGFGQAIAFKDRHFDGGEESGNLLRNGGGTRNDDIEVLGTDIGPYLTVNQLVGNTQLEVVEPMAAFARNLIAFAEMQGPEENHPCDALLLLPRLVNRIVEALEHTRHGAHHCGMDVAHIVGDSGQTFSVID